MNLSTVYIASKTELLVGHTYSIKRIMLLVLYPDTSLTHARTCRGCCPGSTGPLRSNARRRSHCCSSTNTDQRQRTAAPAPCCSCTPCPALVAVVALSEAAPGRFREGSGKVQGSAGLWWHCRRRHRRRRAALGEWVGRLRVDRREIEGRWRGDRGEGLASG